MKQLTRTLFLALMAIACAGLSSCEFFSDNPVSPQLKVRTSSMTIKVGSSQKCNVSASTRAKLLYASNDESIATVDEKGIVTGVSEGDAVITVVATNQEGSELFLDESAVIAVKVVAKGVKTYESDEVRPLTFEAAMDGVTVTFKFKDNAKPDYKKVEYSFDGYTWTALPSPNYPILLKNVGDIVMFRGSNPTYNGDAQFIVEQAASQARSNTRATLAELLHYASLYGTLQSLIEDKNLIGVGTLVKDNADAFVAMFKGAYIDAQSKDGTKKLVLPEIGKEVVPGAFKNMFAGSTIKNAPKVVAKAIGKETLVGMFNNCPALTTVALELGFLAEGVTLEEALKDLFGGTTGTESGNSGGGSGGSGGGGGGPAPDPAPAPDPVPNLVINWLSHTDDTSDPNTNTARVTLDDVMTVSGISTEVLANTKVSVIDESGKASEAKDYVAVERVEILTKQEIEIIEGESLVVEAKVLPENATDKTIDWTTNNDKFVTIEKTSPTKATLKAAIAGKATIRANAGKNAAYIKVTVKAKTVAVTGVTLDQTELELETGGTATLKATVMPDNASDNTVTWTTSDEKVAKVENGEVTAVAAGEAIITATTNDGGFTATCKVTVTAPAEDPSVNDPDDYGDGGDPTAASN